MYKPLRPNWCYSYFDIPNLTQIRAEMLKLHNSTTTDVIVNPYYRNIYRDHIDEDQCPYTINWLKTTGVYNKFQRILLSNGKSTGPVVHIDTYDPYRCQLSVNIPLEHCEDSYTAFYSTKKQTIMPGVLTSYEATLNNFGWLSVDDAEEITRVEVIRPMVVNTTILHRSINDDTRRAICCFRFLPNLTFNDLKRLGVAQPFEQVDV